MIKTDPKQGRESSQVRERVTIRGHLMQLETEYHGTEKSGGGLRGKITGFTSASRRRLIYTIAKTGKALPMFVTLTYGDCWPKGDPKGCQRHLKRWWTRVEYHYRKDRLAMVWKKEWQKRGAPHFHGLVYRKDGGAAFLDKDWVAKSWAECTGDTSEKHINAGTRVEAIRGHHGAMFYAAKYLGKVGEPQAHSLDVPDGEQARSEADEPAKLGRIWGVLGRNNLPGDVVDHWLTPMQMAAFKWTVINARAKAGRHRVDLEGVNPDHHEYLKRDKEESIREELLRFPDQLGQANLISDEKDFVGMLDAIVELAGSSKKVERELARLAS